MEMREPGGTLYELELPPRAVINALLHMKD